MPNVSHLVLMQGKAINTSHKSPYTLSYCVMAAQQTLILLVVVRVRLGQLANNKSPSSNWLGHYPFKVEIRNRTPLAVQLIKLMKLSSSGRYFFKVTYYLFMMPLRWIANQLVGRHLTDKTLKVKLKVLPNAN